MALSHLMYLCLIEDAFENEHILTEFIFDNVTVEIVGTRQLTCCSLPRNVWEPILGYARFNAVNVCVLECQDGRYRCTNCRAISANAHRVTNRNGCGRSSRIAPLCSHRHNTCRRC